MRRKIFPGAPDGPPSGQVVCPRCHALNHPERRRCRFCTLVLSNTPDEPIGLSALRRDGPRDRAVGPSGSRHVGDGRTESPKGLLMHAEAPGDPAGDRGDPFDPELLFREWVR